MKTHHKLPLTFLEFAFIILSGPLFAQVPLGNPEVTDTDPADGATGVSRYLKWVSVTFNKAMDTRYAGVYSQGWGASESYSWSEDQRTLTFSRRNPEDPLNPGAVVSFTLNPPGTMVLRDLAGNLLETYSFSFTVAEAGLEKIEADPQKGFNWPYYLYTPGELEEPIFLLVETNNTLVSDELSVHETRAKERITAQIPRLADPLKVPMLMPVFPRYQHLYTHSLDRSTLVTQQEGLGRIDLQLLAMIEDARSRLAGKGIQIQTRFWMRGFSASGMFAIRFAILHPDKLRAISSGAGGYGPIVPKSRWKGRSLLYPVGVSDLHEVIGKTFNLDSFQQLPVFIYVGDEDYNMTPWFAHNSDPEVPLIREVFGGPDSYIRWPRYEEAFNSAGSHCEFLIVPGLGHEPDWSREIDFFRYHRQSPIPPPRAKPFLYEVFFPHVASYAPWATEIALTSTVGGVDILGELQAYDAQGSLLERLHVILPAGGRFEATIDQLFENSATIAYASFEADSGFLTAYTRFYESLNRIAIPAETGSRSGWFPKKEAGGWTGIAFVNTEQEAAVVQLEAVDNQGSVVEVVELDLPAGAKIVRMARELFERDLSQTGYFRYSSDRKLLGFSVNGSQDGRLMDGMAAGALYLRPENESRLEW